MWPAFMTGVTLSRPCKTVVSSVTAFLMEGVVSHNTLRLGQLAHQCEWWLLPVWLGIVFSFMPKAALDQPIAIRLISRL